MNSTAGVLVDPKLDLDFRRDGVVKLQLFDDSEVQELWKIFNKYKPEIPDGFYSFTFLPDENFKKSMSDDITAIFRNRINAHFKDYKILGGNFLVKSPGDKGEMITHQDWSVVDELKFWAITIWCPLQDVNVKNGALQFLGGSHTAFKQTFRAPTLPQPIENIHHLVSPRLEQFSLNAGEAVAFSHNIFHASPPNRTNDLRVATTLGLIPKDENLCFYFYNESEKLEKLDVGDDFFLRYYDFSQKPPWAKIVDEFEYTPSVITDEEFLAKYPEPSQLPKSKSIFQSLSNFFGVKN